MTVGPKSAAFASAVAAIAAVARLDVKIIRRMILPFIFRCTCKRIIRWSIGKTSDFLRETPEPRDCLWAIVS